VAETSQERLRVWTMADLVASAKYPLWTLWRFLVNFPLALRNTRIILSIFAYTTRIGTRALRVLRRTRTIWSDRTRGRYIWRVAQRFWASWVLGCVQARIDVVGKDRVDWSKPHVVVSNHQSTLDIFPLIAFVPWGRFVAKKEVLALPIIGAACRDGAQIVIDRGNHEQSMRAIRRGLCAWRDCNLIFFAEGTRSLDGRLKPFKKGAFAIAKEMGLSIVPVAISGTYDALPKGSLLRLRRRPRMRLEFGAEVPCDADVVELADRTRAIIGDMIDRKSLPAAA
jgi:1-acyl-sn-glycerol-3-phosphate acyltransferase